MMIVLNLFQNFIIIPLIFLSFMYKFDNNLKPRKIVDKVFTSLKNERITVLLGARQVGKTSILQILQKQLMNSSSTAKDIFYFDLEDMSVLNIIESGINHFLKYLETVGLNKNKKNYVFIDEIQYLSDPSNFLKLIADHHKYIKLIVSGSSSFSIRQKFKDSLAGRKDVFEIWTLDFYEFLEFKEKHQLLQLIKENNFYKIIQGKKIDFESLNFYSAEIYDLYAEFLIYGGYPAVVLELERENKISLLNEINNSYVRKDIKDIMRIDNILAFNNLLKLLSIRAGSLLNISELAASLKITRETLQRYLFTLENTFIIKTLQPLFKNKNKEITKMSKIYFYDTGLRNIIIKNFQNLNDRTDAGAVCENGIFSELSKNLNILDELYFWRTQSKNEVDFILKRDEYYPIEVKYNLAENFKIHSGIKYFTKEYRTKTGFITTIKSFKKKRINNLDIYFIPLWLF